MQGFLALSASDLWVLALALLPPLVAGVPMLLKSVRQPEELALEPVDDAGLEPAPRRWFAQQDARFAEAGFRPAGTWRVTNLPNQRALMRSYASPADSARGGACALVDVRNDAVLAQSWIEFTSAFGDGTLVGTANLRRSRLVRRFSCVQAHDAPGVRHPAELRRIHERNLAPHLVRGVRHLDADPQRFEQEWRSSWARDTEWRCASGLFRRVGGGQTGLTLRGAVLALLDAMLPSLAAVGARRLLLAAALGVGLPFLAYGPGLWWVGMPELTWLSRPSALLAAVLLVPLLETRAIWWAPVLTWLGPRLALGADAAPSGAFTWVAVTQLVVILVSTQQNRWRSRA